MQVEVLICACVFLYSVHVKVCVYVTGGAYVCVQKHMKLAEVSEHYGAGHRVQHDTAAYPTPPFQSVHSCDYGSQTEGGREDMLFRDCKGKAAGLLS